MKKERKSRRRRAEEGIALLIAIFVLLLISVVAIALLVSSGTETALGANYRASSTVYYAALAGLEEARGRLLPKNQNYFGASTISPTSTFPLGQTLYVINAATGGETVAPWNSSNAFFDTQYQSEFGVPASSAAWQSVNSVWNNNAQGIPGPVFKWVRINAVSENSLYMDVNQNGTMDTNYPLFYDPAHLNGSGNPAPSLIWAPSATPSTPTAVQALEITALAALPNGSQKILQYLVAPLPVDITPIAPNQRFLAALTLDGNNVSYQGPNTGAFKIVGDDNTVGRTCSAATIPSVPAIGYTNSGDSSYSSISSGTSYFPSNYKGDQPPLALPPAPSVALVIPPSIFQTPSRVDAIAQSVIQNADVTIPSGPVMYPLSTVNGTTLSANTPTMSPSNPLTVVVNGNLDLTGWHSAGYGMLLVTGDLIYDPDASWDGIVMVIGQGTVTGSHSGIGQINGAVFVAQTRDSSGNLLSDPNLGAASVQFASSMGGNGIRMDSCWVSAALAPVTYKVLSFHEVPQ
jgi:hypothetical protein